MLVVRTGLGTTRAGLTLGTGSTGVPIDMLG